MSEQGEKTSAADNQQENRAEVQKLAYEASSMKVTAKTLSDTSALLEKQLFMFSHPQNPENIPDERLNSVRQLAVENSTEIRAANQKLLLMQLEMNSLLLKIFGGF